MQATIANKSTAPKRPVGVTIAAIVAVSALASAFICWLVYFHAPTDVAGTHLLFLPATNALLNALSTVALLTGFVYIRRREITKHRAAMLTAFFFSSIFLVSYLVNFTLHGETKFPRGNPLWPFYWKLLASHIVLSVVALPIILITFFLSLSGRFPAHKRLARWTFPIWLYVSVTGVIVYAMQAACH
jgi:putative membrane protein